MYNSNAIKSYEQGRDLEQQDRLSEAERAYKKAIKINGDFFEAHNNLGNVLQRRGRLKEATNSFRKAQKILPEHPMLLNNLGNALQLEGENEKALRWLEKAIQIEPRYTDAYVNKGNALSELGQSEFAIDAYRKALEIDQFQADAYNNLGNVYIDLEQFDDALESFKKAIAISPQHKDAYNGLGNAYAGNKDCEQAIVSYRKALELNPKNKDAYNGLGNMFTEQEEFDKAVQAYRKTIELDHGHTNAYIGLANALAEQGETDQALPLLHKAIQLSPENPVFYSVKGRILADSGEIENAVAAYQKSIELDPAHKPAYTGLGSLYSDMGDIEASVTTYRKAIDSSLESAELYRVLSKNKKFSGYDDDLRTMESLYQDGNASDEQKMHLAFALGKVYEDLKDYDNSIDYVIEGARLKRSSIEYSNTASQDFFDAIKTVFSADFLASHDSIGNPDPTPVFIIGMPRSGTSLTEQILASHPQVYGAGELRHLDRSIKTLLRSHQAPATFPQGVKNLEVGDFQELGRQYLERLREYAPDATYITDKLPHNFLYIGLIKIILPNARIIHCARDPMDNALSILKNFFTSGHFYSYDRVELGRYYRLYLELMDYWRALLPGFIYDLNYESLVSDQENQIRRLLEYCNLPWDDACLDFHKTRRKVKTASNAQVRRPIYRDSVALWKRYEKQLEPLRAAIYD